jgi:hypothetical protein
MTGHALIDHEVYLHKEWFAEGNSRLSEAHAPGPVAKRTTGKRAAEMLRRVPARPTAVSATGDEVYGNSPHLRRGHYSAGLALVLALPGQGNSGESRVRPVRGRMGLWHDPGGIRTHSSKINRRPQSVISGCGRRDGGSGYA